jgi:microcystin-dependent protein
MPQFAQADIVEEAIGTIKLWSTASAPTKWLKCDGSAVSRTTYAALFSVIGTTWGVGDNSTTFNLPDFVGASPAGVGTSSGYTQNETVALATKYNDQLQGHWHQAYAPNAAAGGNGLAAGCSVGQSPASNYGWNIKEPIADTDNSYGTPRVAAATKGKTVGVHFIIKAE